MLTKTWPRLVVSLCLTAAAFVAWGATGRTQEEKQGKKYALLVGVRSYDHRKLTDLKYTENDAEAMADVLTAARYDEVVVLTTTRGEKDAKRRPTKANIEAELKRLLKKVTKHDVVLVGLAGHGVQYEVKDGDKKKRDESFFCPSDARLIDSDDFARLSETLLPFRELFRRLDDSGAGSRLLLVDACRNDPGSSRNADTDAMPRPTRGTAALFSCKGGERAFESDKLPGAKGHGVFFYHVIEGLRGKAKGDEGDVTWNDLTRHVSRAVPRAVAKYVGGGARQTPHLMANVEGDPVLLHVGGGGGVVEEPRDKDKGKDGGKEPVVRDGEWVKLFNGKDLEGWVAEKGIWQVKGEEIIGTGNGRPLNTFLYTKQTYKDFELEFDAKVVGQNNSGVTFRGKLNKASKYYIDGMKLDLGDRSGWGTLVPYDGNTNPTPPVVTLKNSPLQKRVKPNDYNRVLLRCVGNKVTVRINGTAFVDQALTGLNAQGYIGFQVRKGIPTEVRLKNIRLREVRTGD